jgi:hypothetical protein
MPAATPETLAKARDEHLRRAAVRALNDPIALARAARIVRAALERGRLTPEDLTPPDAA